MKLGDVLVEGLFQSAKRLDFEGELSVSFSNRGARRLLRILKSYGNDCGSLGR